MNSPWLKGLASTQPEPDLWVVCVHPPRQLQGLMEGDAVVKLWWSSCHRTTSSLQTKNKTTQNLAPLVTDGFLAHDVLQLYKLILHANSDNYHSATKKIANVECSNSPNHKGPHNAILQTSLPSSESAAVCTWLWCTYDIYHLRVANWHFLWKVEIPKQDQYIYAHTLYLHLYTNYKLNHIPH